ncbi:hypothetical protein cypCar_00046342, partial [Cyprinus carpio]
LKEYVSELLGLRAKVPDLHRKNIQLEAVADELMATAGLLRVGSYNHRSLLTFLTGRGGRLARFLKSSSAYGPHLWDPQITSDLLHLFTMLRKERGDG